eukprot:5685446-Prymnesium_polylepis.1
MRAPPRAPGNSAPAARRPLRAGCMGGTTTPLPHLCSAERTRALPAAPPPAAAVAAARLPPATDARAC